MRTANLSGSHYAHRIDRPTLWMSMLHPESIPTTTLPSNLVTPCLCACFASAFNWLTSALLCDQAHSSTNHGREKTPGTQGSVQINVILLRSHKANILPTTEPYLFHGCRTWILATSVTIQKHLSAFTSALRNVFLPIKTTKTSWTQRRRIEGLTGTLLPALSNTGIESGGAFFITVSQVLLWFTKIELKQTYCSDSRTRRFKMVFYIFRCYLWGDHRCWAKTSISVASFFFFMFPLSSTFSLLPTAQPLFRRPWFNVFSV